MNTNAFRQATSHLVIFMTSLLGFPNRFLAAPRLFPYELWSDVPSRNRQTGFAKKRSGYCSKLRMNTKGITWFGNPDGGWEDGSKNCIHFANSLFSRAKVIPGRFIFRSPGISISPVPLKPCTYFRFRARTKKLTLGFRNPLRVLFAISLRACLEISGWSRVTRRVFQRSPGAGVARGREHPPRNFPLRVGDFFLHLPRPVGGSRNSRGSQHKFRGRVGVGTTARHRGAENEQEGDGVHSSRNFHACREFASRWNNTSGIREPRSGAN